MNFQDMYRKAFDVWRDMDAAEHDADIVDSIFNAMLAAHAAGYQLAFDAGYDAGYDDAEQEQAAEIAEATKAFGVMDAMDNSDVLFPDVARAAEVVKGPDGLNTFVMVRG